MEYVDKDITIHHAPIVNETEEEMKRKDFQPFQVPRAHLVPSHQMRVVIGKQANNLRSQTRIVILTIFPRNILSTMGIDTLSKIAKSKYN